MLGRSFVDVDRGLDRAASGCGRVATCPFALGSTVPEDGEAGREVGVLPASQLFPPPLPPKFHSVCFLCWPSSLETPPDVPGPQVTP